MRHRNAVHGEDVVDRGVVHVAETGDRPDARHVDVAVDNHGIVDVDVDHLADDEGIDRLLPVRADELDGAVVDAFERDRRAFDPRRLHHPGRHHPEPGEVGLADVLGMIAAGDVHLAAQLPGREIEHELARGLRVALRVLAGAAGEHDEGRPGRNDVEEAVGRQIDDASRADGRDPADRPRHDQASPGIMGETVRLAARIVVHAMSFPVQGPDADRTRGAVALVQGLCRTKGSFAPDVRALDQTRQPAGIRLHIGGKFLGRQEEDFGALRREFALDVG